MERIQRRHCTCSGDYGGTTVEVDQLRHCACPCGHGPGFSPNSEAHGVPRHHQHVPKEPLRNQVLRNGQSIHMVQHSHDGPAGAVGRKVRTQRQDQLDFDRLSRATREPDRNRPATSMRHVDRGVATGPRPRWLHPCYRCRDRFVRTAVSDNAYRVSTDGLALHRKCGVRGVLPDQRVSHTLDVQHRRQYRLGRAPGVPGSQSAVPSPILVVGLVLQARYPEQRP